MRSVWPLITSIAVILVFSHGTARADAIMKTIVPSEIRAGETYTLYIEADNRGLSGDVTVGIQWRLGKPDYIEVLTSSLPSADDFFEGFDMFSAYNFVKPPGQLSARAA